MKRLIFILCIAFVANNSHTYAQENNEPLSVSVDVASGFVWRGLLLNSLPVVQPSVSLSLGKFTIGAWASTPWVSKWNQSQELDLFVNYGLLPFLSLNVTDYYVYNSGLSDSYFNYNRKQTCHALDVQLAFTGTDHFPFKVMVSTIIAGNDLNDRDKNNFSTYIELGYGNTFQRVDWELSAGIVPMASSFYETSCVNVINLGLEVSKSFQITQTYALPLSVKLTVNPASESVYLTAAITLF